MVPAEPGDVVQGDDAPEMARKAGLAARYSWIDAQHLGQRLGAEMPLLFGIPET